MFLDKEQALLIILNDDSNNQQIQSVAVRSIETEEEALNYIRSSAVKIYVATFDEYSLRDVTEDLADCFLKLVDHDLTDTYPDWVKSSSSFSALELEG